MERIAGGFSLAEAPVVTLDDVLLVSDVLGGGVRRFDAGGTELPPLLDRRRGIGGMGVRPDGSVVVSGRDLSIVGTDGELTVLAESVAGGRGFNDLAITPEGHVLAGLLTCAPMAGDALTPGIFVLVDAAGTRTTAPLPACWPNGVGFSPGGDDIYLADFDTGVVHRSPWTGSLAGVHLEPWVTSPTGDADGLAVDDGGDVWIAGGSGGDVLRYDPTGERVTRLDVPDDFVSSCCFWPGRDRLVVTTGTGVFFHDLAG